MSRTIIVKQKRSYTLLSFLFDLIMCFVTGGLWLIWIFIREMRNR